MVPFRTSKRKVRYQTETRLDIDQLGNMRYRALTLIQEDSREDVHFSLSLNLPKTQTFKLIRGYLCTIIMASII